MKVIHAESEIESDFSTLLNSLSNLLHQEFTVKKEGYKMVFPVAY